MDKYSVRLMICFVMYCVGGSACLFWYAVFAYSVAFVFVAIPITLFFFALLPEAIKDWK